MGLRVRTDIFRNCVLPVNTENIHEKPASVSPPLGNDSRTSNTDKISYEKRKKDTEQLEVKWKKSYNEKEEYKVEDEQRSENGPKNSTDIEDWFNARRILLGLKIPGTKRQRLEASEEANNGCQEEASKVRTNSTSTDNKVNTFESSDPNYPVKFSNYTKDIVQTVCQICKNGFSFTNMRSHTKSVHKITITEYKKKYGQLMDHIVEPVYHKCGICDKAILLDIDRIAPHAGSHGMSHKEYSAKYLILTKGMAKTMQPQKLIQSTVIDKNSIKEKSAMEILAELEEMIATI